MFLLGRDDALSPSSCGTIHRHAKRTIAVHHKDGSPDARDVATTPQRCVTAFKRGRKEPRDQIDSPGDRSPIVHTSYPDPAASRRRNASVPPRLYRLFPA